VIKQTKQLPCGAIHVCG